MTHWLIGIVVLAAGVVSAAVSAGMLTLSRRRGWVDAVGSEAHKRHDLPTPNTGGVGVFLAVAAPLAAALLGAFFVGGGDGPLAVHAPGVRSVAPQAAVVLAALAVLHVTGLVDDRLRLPAWPKLVVQVTAAIGVATLADVRALVLLDDVWPGGGGYAVSVGLSVVWLVAVTNAINFLDNMDALAGGIAAIVAGVYLAMAVLAGQWFIAGASAAVLGACLGFLLFNYPPAKLFMGDGGSLVLGFVLAVIAIRTTYLTPVTSGEGGADGAAFGAASGGAWYGVLTPLVVLAVPLYDLVSVTVIRLSQGRSPFQGDHQHFSHRLAFGPDAGESHGQGLGKRGAVWAIWLCTLATALSGVLLPRLGPGGAVLVFVQTLAVLGVIAVLERPWRRMGRSG